ncbi:MAG: molybdopterin cofactor-binding domain-containing protein, partial [Myxococcota bacterium]
MAKLTRRSFLTTGLAATATGAIASEARAEAPAGEPAPSDPLSVQAEVDGESLTFLVGPDTTALHALRAAGRTGVKEGCGHGACGACTIVRDARTTCACLLPATALQGAKVTTVHGLGAKGLHPVQRAFMAEDALQCGFCTPGFVVEAADWVDRWRAEHGDVEPTRDRVAAALAGHLCRCGAYVAIYRAVQGAAAGRYDAGDDVGPRKDGHAKVTGEARYTVDVQLPGMLHGAILRAPFARGRLQRLDLAAARSVPGVHGVIRLLEDGASIRYFGQEIAAVAADDEASAQAGLKALAPELESERPILGFEDAMAEGAPTIFPKRAHKQAPSAAEGFLPPAPWDESNVRGPFRSDWFSGHRKASDILDEASLTVEERYETQIQAHCTLEPHATVAQVHESGQIEVWASTQAVVQLVHDIAERFDVHERDIVVHADYVGGGFGAKAGITIDAVVAIELAYETGRPVRVVLSR